LSGPCSSSAGARSGENSPFKFGQLEWPVKDAAAKSEEAVEALEDRVQKLEVLAELADPPVED